MRNVSALVIVGLSVVLVRCSSKPVGATATLGQLETMLRDGHDAEFLSATNGWAQEAPRRQPQELLRAAVERGVDCNPDVLLRLHEAGAEFSLTALAPVPEQVAECPLFSVLALPGLTGFERQRLFAYLLPRVQFARVAAASEKDEARVLAAGRTFHVLLDAVVRDCSLGLDNACAAAGEYVSVADAMGQRSSASASR